MIYLLYIFLHYTSFRVQQDMVKVAEMFLLEALVYLVNLIFFYLCQELQGNIFTTSSLFTLHGKMVKNNSSKRENLKILEKKHLETAGNLMESKGNSSLEENQNGRNIGCNLIWQVSYLLLLKLTELDGVF